MNTSLVKAIVLTKEWEYIEQFLRDEFNKIEVDTNKAINEIGKRYLAKKLALKHLDTALLALNKVKSSEIKKNIKYR